MPLHIINFDDESSTRRNCTELQWSEREAISERRTYRNLAISKSFLIKYKNALVQLFIIYLWPDCHKFVSLPSISGCSGARERNVVALQLVGFFTWNNQGSFVATIAFWLIVWRSLELTARFDNRNKLIKYMINIDIMRHHHRHRLQVISRWPCVWARRTTWRKSPNFSLSLRFLTRLFRFKVMTRLLSSPCSPHPIRSRVEDKWLVGLLCKWCFIYIFKWPGALMWEFWLEPRWRRKKRLQTHISFQWWIWVEIWLSKQLIA